MPVSSGSAVRVRFAPLAATLCAAGLLGRIGIRPAAACDRDRGAALPPPRQFRLGPAATSLVSQAHTQLNGGDFGLAAATIERAMRVEPDNPLLWIELGRVRYTAGDVAQAQSMGRKALVLATGDPRAQSSAWKLIADSLRAQRRNPEAADADRHAQELLQR